MGLTELCTKENYPYVRQYCIASIPVYVYSENLFLFDVVEKEFPKSQYLAEYDKGKSVSIWFRKKTFCEVGLDGDLAFLQRKNGFIFLNRRHPNKAYCLYDDCDNELIRLTIIKSVAAYAMTISKGLIHGSLVQCHGVGITLIGKSGSGKSSLSAGLVLKYNAKLIADDGYIFDLETFPTIAYGLNSNTGIDLNALNQLSIDIPSELMTISDNMADFRKRKYVNMDAYKDDSTQPHSSIDAILFLIPSYSHHCSLKRLSSLEMESHVIDMAIPYFYEDLPSPDTKNQMVAHIKKIPCYEFNISDNYLKNLEYIYEKFLKKSYCKGIQ